MLPTLAFPLLLSEQALRIRPQLLCKLVYEKAFPVVGLGPGLGNHSGDSSNGLAIDFVRWYICLSTK